MGEPKQAAADARRQIREFLATRRARLTPDQVGLPVYGGNRRVKGLRREEVATLAGISVEYYIRLERGEAHGVSESVLEGINHALQLDPTERAHLLDLVRASGGTRPLRRLPTEPTLRPPIQRILDSMATTPALVYSGRLDILGTNALGRALFAPLYADPARPVNMARFAFLDPAARTFWRDWPRIADDNASTLRTEAGRNPCDADLTTLIGELSTRSEAFRTRWAKHDVHLHTTGVKRIHHPVVGDLELPYEATPLAADPGQTLLMYTADPTSPTADALRLLASWAASEQPESHPTRR
ncbi:helix-turn-helix domain-containing protein [Dactylosporangium matsuzakiense]|uniref:Transcriptional regulator n=1 Tax=Dactylosporangium matsuzakiense TaxID=53360 RepID=A0A9W6KBW5_9ACTN|nr:helix-turn-helix transcriptional regulator [Dactylosporangium matsuzakiense]GLK98657.1 transcriptional regulator [Dactylosporangium matsuzakiense]